GAVGPEGPQGPAGTDGKGITSTIDNGDGTFTITYTDTTTFTSSDLTGPQGATGTDGPQGPQGLQGVGISNSTDNGDGTLTFNYTDGTNFTTPNLIGPQGPQGDPATNIITNLSQNTVSGVITYVNEENGSQTANVVSNDSNNRITVGSDGGAYLGFRYFDAYDATGSTPITTSFSTIAFNTTRINLNGFTMTNGVITIPQKGLYEITYTVSFDHTANVNSRANVETVLDLNGSTVPGTTSYTYHRRNFGQDSATKTVILDLSVNQTISVKSRLTNNNNGITIDTIAEGSSITIKRLQ
ncbi:C1q-like domain-containing protein, partial [Pontimicrobium sp. MEBiC01747]